MCILKDDINLQITIATGNNTDLKILLTDNTVYANPNTVKGVIKIEKDGKSIYFNNNFNSPNVNVAVSRNATIQCQNASNIDGLWTFTYSVLINGITYCKTYTQYVLFKVYDTAISTAVDCSIARLVVEDITNYNANYNATQVAYSLTLDSPSTPITFTTSKGITVNYPNLYNEEYTATINSQQLYQLSPNVAIRYTWVQTHTYSVECVSNHCEELYCINCMWENLQRAKQNNPVQYQYLYKDYVYASTLFAHFKAALECGLVNEANKVSIEIKAITKCNGCKGCADTKQVVPAIFPCSGTPDPCPPCPGCNFSCNDEISQQVQKECPPSQVGSYVTVVYPQGRICNPDKNIAQAEAQRLFDLSKQATANEQGTCNTICTIEGGTPTPMQPCCAGLYLEGTVCVSVCSDGFAPVNGVCQPVCSPVGSPSSPTACCQGLVSQNGVCQVSCNPGYAPDGNGVCQVLCIPAGQSPTMTASCCAGLVIQDGVCATSCSNGYTPNINNVCVPLCSPEGQPPHPEFGCCGGLVNQDGICKTQCNEGYAPDGNGVCVQSCATNGQTNTLPCCNGLKPIRFESSFFPQPPPIGAGDGICSACLPVSYIGRPREYTPSDPNAGVNYYDLPCCSGLHRFRAFWNNTNSVTICTATCSTVSLVIGGNSFTYNSEPTADTYGSICVPCAGNGQTPITWNGQPKCCSGFVFDSGTNTCIPA
jgi:hypothetical protein